MLLLNSFLLHRIVSDPPSSDKDARCSKGRDIDLWREKKPHWGEEKKLGLLKEILCSWKLGRGSVCKDITRNHHSSSGSEKQREH